MNRKLSRIIAASVVGILAVSVLGAILLCEVALRLGRKPLTEKTRVLAERGARQLGAEMHEVQIASFDGAQLSAWFFRPQQSGGDTVILLHGHADNRAGMLGFVPMLLHHQYNILVPDARAHGESGGDIATYGLYESRDLSHWLDWLSSQSNQGCVYALGESMGAGILLQTLSNESRFCAAVAESPYASFREVAYDRLSQKFGMEPGVGRFLFAPLVSEAFLYAKLRYGIDFDQEKPGESVASTHVPILLIHGTEDFNIPLRHCEVILKNHSGVMEFWQVPGAGHTGAFGREPQEFERRVTDWFSRFSQR